MEKVLPVKSVELKISLAVSAALMVQVSIGFVWVGAAGERLAHLERQSTHVTQLVERTARLEERTRSITDTLERIEGKLTRNYEVEVSQ